MEYWNRNRNIGNWNIGKEKEEEIVHIDEKRTEEKAT